MSFEEGDSDSYYNQSGSDSSGPRQRNVGQYEDNDEDGLVRNPLLEHDRDELDEDEKMELRESEEAKKDAGTDIAAYVVDDSGVEGQEHVIESRKFNARAEEINTNLCRLGNLPIPVFYFMLGFALRFPVVALREFLIHKLYATPPVQTLVNSVVMFLPFSLKIFLAFFSDSMPILGQRRKPYILLGVVICSLSWVTLGSIVEPSLTQVCVLLFTAVLGLVFSDTMTDTLVVERCRYERDVNVGRMQTYCWIMRYSGCLVGILSGGLLLKYGHLDYQLIFIIQGLCHCIVVLPFLIVLHDEDVSAIKRPNCKQNLQLIWEAIKQNSIWMPMIFVYSWNLMPNDGDAWVNFLLGPLKFTDDIYSYLLATGTIAGALGSIIYRECFKNMDLHKVFYGVIISATVLSALPFVLIFRLNAAIGIPDVFFAFGNEVIQDVVGFIILMPVLIMCAKLCPDHVEGTIYALTCCVQNIASQIGGNISSALSFSYGITLTNYDNLWKLHLTVVLCSLIPLAFVWMTPHQPGDGNPDDYKRVRMEREYSKKLREYQNDDNVDMTQMHSSIGAQALAQGLEPPKGTKVLEQTRVEAKTESFLEGYTTTEYKAHTEVADEMKARLEEEKLVKLNEPILFGVHSKVPKSFMGGLIFSIVLFGGLLWSIIDALVKLANFVNQRKG